MGPSGFNPRARVGRDTRRGGRLVVCRRFQSTRPRGARRCFSSSIRGNSLVSIHAPAWGATVLAPILAPLIDAVSIHAPAWGATFGRARGAWRGRCFNPRARVGRDLCRWSAVRPESQFQSTRPRGARRRVQVGGAAVVIVSIHAPAWGATRHCRGRRGRRGVSIHAPAWGATIQAAPHRHQQVGVSIHAPAWGATRASIRTGPVQGRFNPRARVGRDRQSPLCADRRADVSIHAPAWGATALCVLNPPRSSSFNPRARVGRDDHWPGPGFRVDGFNPRARVGRDRNPSPNRSLPRCFNPRARVGRDVTDSGFYLERFLFQSTRPRGARRCSVRPDESSSSRFNPRARVGRDRGLNGPAFYWGIGFNPRARVGRDVTPWSKGEEHTLFQSTRPRGARRDHRPRESYQREFQSTRPRGARRLPAAGCWAGTRFQSTRPRGARPADPEAVIRLPEFQSTRPRGARRAPAPRLTVNLSFQSTRPRGARRPWSGHSAAHQAVSIHAPAWGATGGAHFRRRCPEVSIHAPAWGAT